MRKSESILEACKYWIKNRRPTKANAKHRAIHLSHLSFKEYKGVYLALVRMKVESLRDSIGMYRQIDQIEDVARAILLVAKELNKR